MAKRSSIREYERNSPNLEEGLVEETPVVDVNELTTTALQPVESMTMTQPNPTIVVLRNIGVGTVAFGEQVWKAGEVHKVPKTWTRQEIEALRANGLVEE